MHNTGNYDLTAISYDKNGNILSLNRQGHINEEANLFGVMDDLIYTYDNGNKLLRVEDIADDIYGFKDDAVAVADNTDDYSYDDNGNMISDTNKGITAISYNHLNLPTQVTINGENILYIYDASGVKQQKVAAGTTTQYAGAYIYENSSLKFANHPEGYIEPDGGGGYNYVYQYKDHLGNVRLSYSDSNSDGLVESSEIMSEKNYYPFGLTHQGYNGQTQGTYHPYGFGGKEEQSELDLEWLDFSARNYDSALGRWMNIDPLAESMTRHSPYNYAFNSPVYYVDPDGMAPIGRAGNDEYSRRMEAKSNMDPYFDGQYIAKKTDGGNNGPGDPPKTYKGTGVAIGDNVVNVLEGVTVVSGRGTGTSETDRYQYSGSFEQWKKEFGYSGSYLQVKQNYEAEYGSSHRASMDAMEREALNRDAAERLLNWGRWFAMMTTVYAGEARFPNVSPKSFNYTPRISPLKYHPRLDKQVDLYHNFPRSFDRHIIKNGMWSQRITDRANWYELYGTINGRNGIYQIGVNNKNIIFHKNFVPF